MGNLTERVKRVKRVKEGYGELDGILMDWMNKVKLDGWLHKKALQTADVKDLKQEVLINIVTRLEEYKPERAQFETWAFNRTRAVIRTWMRVKIREQNPILRKGFRGESLTGKVVMIGEFLEDWIPAEEIYSDVEEYIEELNMVIDEMNIKNNNRISTKRTLQMMADGKSRKEISRTLNVTTGKINADIRRLQKAVEILEDATILN